MERVDHLLARRGVAAVLAGRLIPVVPFTAINYVAGLSGVRLGHFMIGTAVGIVPGTLGSVAVGAFGSRLASWPFVAPYIAVVAAVMVATGWASRHLARPARTPLKPWLQRSNTNVRRHLAFWFTPFCGLWPALMALTELPPLADQSVQGSPT